MSKKQEKELLNIVRAKYPNCEVKIADFPRKSPKKSAPKLEKLKNRASGIVAVLSKNGITKNVIVSRGKVIALEG